MADRCPSKFRFFNNSYHSAAGAETDQRGPGRGLSGLSASFYNTRCRSLAMFQQPQLLPRKLAAARYLHFGLRAFRSRNTHSASFLKAAGGFFTLLQWFGLLLPLRRGRGRSKSKPASINLLNYIASGRFQKSRQSERWKTAYLFARFVIRVEGTAQRRDFAAIAVAPET